MKFMNSWKLKNPFYGPAIGISDHRNLSPERREWSGAGTSHSILLSGGHTPQIVIFMKFMKFSWNPAEAGGQK